MKCRVWGTAYVDGRVRGIKRSALMEVKRMPFGMTNAMDLFVDCVSEELADKGKTVDEVFITAVEVVKR